MVAVTSHDEDFPRLRISAERWHRMIAEGIIREDEHVELLEGDIHVMTPPNPPHGVSITELVRLLGRALDDRWRVISQSPLSLDQESEPQPDVAVIETKELSPRHHPRRAKLVIEVADSSLGLDRVLKLRLYARSGVPEYWIVNVEEHEVEVYRRPDRKGGHYRVHQVLTEGEVARCTALPKVRVPVKSLFR